MKQTATLSTAGRSLAETYAEGFQFFLANDAPSGRGCILQIYPASAQAEMIRLNAQRSLIGRDPSCNIPLDDQAVSRIHAAIELDDAGYFVTDLGSRNGTFVNDQMLCDPRRLQGGELIRLGSTILKFMSSMDEEAQYHAVVHELMTRDPLTNAFNRSYLMSMLEKLLPRFQLTKQALSVVMIDIDYFKKVNDSHGHLGGDEVLRIFSERIRHELRETDVLCRLGGEEFVVISKHTELPEAVQIAETIRLVIASTPFHMQSGQLNITCSLGVATLDPACSCTVDNLLSEADQLMYTAKANGRNQVCSALAQ